VPRDGDGSLAEAERQATYCIHSVVNYTLREHPLSRAWQLSRIQGAPTEVTTRIKASDVVGTGEQTVKNPH
jgi:hypothetical protein